MDWGADFGVPLIWVSDRGTHFKNTVMSEIAEVIGARHHFTTASMHFPNGTIERLCSIAQECFRLLTSDMKVDEDCWPDVIPAVRYILNHSPRASLDNMSPITVFCGHPEQSPLDNILLPNLDVFISSTKVSAENIPLRTE